MFVSRSFKAFAHDYWSGTQGSLGQEVVVSGLVCIGGFGRFGLYIDTAQGLRGVCVAGGRCAS